MADSIKLPFVNITSLCYLYIHVDVSMYIYIFAFELIGGINICLLSLMQENLWKPFLVHKNPNLQSRLILTGCGYLVFV